MERIEGIFTKHHRIVHEVGEPHSAFQTKKKAKMEEVYEPFSRKEISEKGTVYKNNVKYDKDSSVIDLCD